MGYILVILLFLAVVAVYKVGLGLLPPQQDTTTNPTEEKD